MKILNLIKRLRIQDIQVAYFIAGQKTKNPVRNRFFLFRPASPFIIFKIISIFKSLKQSNFNQYLSAKAIIFFLKGYENK